MPTEIRSVAEGLKLARRLHGENDYFWATKLLREMLPHAGPQEVLVQNLLTRVALDERGIKPAIIWLASFPRTGSTWLRFLLTHLLQGPFDRSAVVNMVCPTLEYGLTEDSFTDRSPVFIKVHNDFESFQAVAADYLDRTAGILYVARHPADTLFSNLNYRVRQSRTPMDEAELHQFEVGFRRLFLGAAGDAGYGKLGYGTYLRHYASWKEQTRFAPMAVLLYENLITAPRETLGQVRGKFGLGFTDAAIKDAIAACGFARMREIENREAQSAESSAEYQEWARGSAIPPRRAGGEGTSLYFVNRGESGYGWEILTQAEREQLASAFAPMLDDLGYSSEAG